MFKILSRKSCDLLGIIYPCSASAVKEVALKETQELLKEEKEEVATLKVCYLLYMPSSSQPLHFYFQCQAQMDLVDQSKDSVNIEEVMEEKYVTIL